MTSFNGYIQGLGNGEKRTVDKRGKEIKLSVFDNIDRVIVFNEAGETSQEGTPTPDNPVPINGIGFKRPDGTYTVTISYDDGDEHYGTIIASGLAYPLYEGDVLDFVNGKVIRANGCKVFDGTEDWAVYSVNSGYSVAISDMKSMNFGVGYSDRFSLITSASTENNRIRFGGNNTRVYIYYVNISGVSDLATWKTWLSNNDTYIVYPLATPTDEYITLSGDISEIGTATVTADGTLTVQYDKAEMAIRKYSPKPDWSKIGYSNTPNAVINAFDYAKRIYDNWSFRKFTGDLNLRIFPNVDISGQLGLNGMFKGCTNLMSIPSLEIGTDSGTLNASEFARASGIEEVDLTSNNLNQENNFQNGFNGCAFLKSYSITAKASNVNAMFSGCSSLIEAPDFDTSTTANFSEMFAGCSSLTYVSDDFDTSSGTNFYRCFYNCSSLESIPSWDVRTGTNLQQLFAGCSSIKNVPPLTITAATNLTNMFQNSGSNLTELSRNNILMMLATASSYTGTKTLAAVGFTSSMYSAASWQALTNYGDFTDAGWSIGYS